ncbi:hypothetical protein WDJ51_13685 [Rathayibacter sp. YIM 133350]|uniref:hypothetical protein n=1 Tax=Rathayibacter sp. YIM 133350 TaxID=3131992 RepID=UPI00307E5DAF
MSFAALVIAGVLASSFAGGGAAFAESTPPPTPAPTASGAPTASVATTAAAGAGAHLTLAATVDNGASDRPAAVGEFVLTATGDFGEVHGVTGSPAVTDAAVRSDRYVLGFQGPSRYTPEWSCDGGEFIPENWIDGPATIVLDEDDAATCSVVLVAKVVLHVTAGGDRLASGAVAGVAGVTFRAHAYYRPVRFRPDELPVTITGTCTTDAAGSCDIEVGVISAADQALNFSYWVTALNPAPAGWSLIPEFLQTGDGGHSTYTYANYVNVPPGTAGQRVDVSRAGLTYPSGTPVNGPFPLARTSALPHRCTGPLKIALAFDTSSSMTAAKLQVAKDAAAAALGPAGLGGRDTRVTIYSFAHTAKKLTPVPFPLSNIAGRVAAIGLVKSLAAESGQDRTNVDGLYRRVAADGPYDLVLVVSDGIATEDAAGRLGVNQTVQLAHPVVFSANRIKAQTGPAGKPSAIFGIGAWNSGAVTGGTAVPRSESVPKVSADLHALVTGCG